MQCVNWIIPRSLRAAAAGSLDAPPVADVPPQPATAVTAVKTTNR
jgi:hypothetical protein